MDWKGFAQRYSSPYFSQKELLWLKAWSKVHWNHWVLVHSLSVVKPAIKLKAQLNSSTTELLFFVLQRLCPYCRVTRNVIVDISKVKESSLKECRGLCSCLFCFCCVFSNLLTSILMLVVSLYIVSPGHRFCSGNSYWAESSQKDGDPVECAKFKTINIALNPDGFLVSFIVMYFLLLSSVWGDRKSVV